MCILFIENTVQQNKQKLLAYSKYQPAHTAIISKHTHTAKPKYSDQIILRKWKQSNLPLFHLS